MFQVLVVETHQEEFEFGGEISPGEAKQKALAKAREKGWENPQVLACRRCGDE